MTQPTYLVIFVLPTGDARVRSRHRTRAAADRRVCRAAGESVATLALSPLGSPVTTCPPVDAIVSFGAAPLQVTSWRLA